MPASRNPAAFPRPVLAEALIWAGVLACAIGFVVERMWLVLPAARLGETLALAGLAGLLAWPLRRWRDWAWADALALVWLLALVALTGVAPALAVAAVAAAAAGLGSLLAGNARPVLAMLAGLAVLSAIVGWLLPLPGHRWWVYAPLLAVVIVARRGALHAQGSSLLMHWRGAVDAAPVAAGWGTLLLGLASAGAWLPTMQHDDLAYHLGLPWQLMLHGSYSLDPTHQVWALAPWAGDVLQAIPQLLARAEARSALNAVWLLATAAGLWRIGASLGLRPAMRWATLGLYASLPMVAALLGGMQTETPAAAVTVALAALVLDTGEGERDRIEGNGGLDWNGLDGSGPLRHRLIVGALLFGLLCALKPLHGFVATPLLVWAAWRGFRRPRTRPRWTRLVVAAMVAVLVAGPSYAYAWAIAGNPVLPLYNGVFGSRYFAAENLNDPRWQAGFGGDLPWRLTFDTARHLEGWDGGIGFVLVAAAGAWLVALAAPRTRALAACASLSIVVPLLPLQYARYLHPGMVLLLPALVAVIDRGLPPRRALWLLAGLCGANLAFQANAQWFLHTGAVKRGALALGRDGALFGRYAPERALIAAIRARAPGNGAVLVLDPDTPSYAELAGRGRTTAWYDPAIAAASQAADRDPSGAAWSALLRRERIAEVIVRPAALTSAQHASLAALGARRALVIGEAQWWRIPAEGAR